MNVFFRKFFDVMSSSITRIIAILLCFFLGLTIMKFNNSMVAFAKEVETSSVDEIIENKDELDFNENEDVLYIQLDDTGDNESDLELKSSDGNISQSDVEENDNFVLCKLESSDKYPDGWIEDFNKKILLLQNMFPDGLYWNHMDTKLNENNNVYNVTTIPCNHSINGESFCNEYKGKSDEVYPYESACVQCRGFASLLSDMVFGEDANIRVFENYDDLRIGDQARIDGDYHSVFIIDKTDEFVVVAECNEDLNSCKISWGRKIPRDKMAGWYISRWE